MKNFKIETNKLDEPKYGMLMSQYVIRLRKPYYSSFVFCLFLGFKNICLSWDRKPRSSK